MILTFYVKNGNIYYVTDVFFTLKEALPMSNIKDLKGTLVEKPVVTREMQKQYFPGKNFSEIRDMLEEMGLQRTMPIELVSTEIAIFLPEGIVMQERATDAQQLGLWGGVVNDGEKPRDGAVRRLAQETGMKIDKNQLRFVEVDPHVHVYDNGDEAIFHAHRYILNLYEEEKFQTDSESSAVILTKDNEEELDRVLSHQRDFVRNCWECLE